MKCIHCGREWTDRGPNDTFEKCPFCGHVLTKGNTADYSVDAGLRKIVEIGGEEVLRDSKLLLSYFSDVMPNRQKEKRLLQCFLECKGNTTLLDDLKRSKSLLPSTSGRIVTKMVNDYYVNEDAAKKMVHVFWSAIGGDAPSPRITENSTRTITQPKTIREIPNQKVQSIGDQSNTSHRRESQTPKKSINSRRNKSPFFIVGIVLCVLLFLIIRACNRPTKDTVNTSYEEIPANNSSDDYSPIYSDLPVEIDEQLDLSITEEDPFISVEGNIIQGEIATEGQTDYYLFTAPNTGRYRFDFEVSDVNKRFDFVVVGQNGIVLKDTSSYYDGTTVDLEEAKTYEIQIIGRDESFQYFISIGTPKLPVEITGTLLSSSITYTDQRDYYYFKAPITGRYYFSFDVSDVNCRFSFVVYNSKNETLADTTSYYSGKALDLEAGDEYTIIISQHTGYMNYTVQIGIPHEIQTVTNSRITGTIAFESQRDRYLYSAPITGRYYFSFDVNDVNCRFSFVVYNSKNETLADTTSYYSGKVLDLTEGETYSIIVVQNSGLVDYDITINVPQEPSTISGNTIQGSLNFTSKRDIYYYKAPFTGQYTLALTSSDSTARYDFIMWDSKNNTIIDTTSYYSERTVNLVADEIYTIWIVQNTGYPTYTITLS